MEWVPTHFSFIIQGWFSMLSSGADLWSTVVLAGGRYWLQRAYPSKILLSTSTGFGRISPAFHGWPQLETITASVLQDIVPPTHVFLCNDCVQSIQTTIHRALLCPFITNKLFTKDINGRKKTASTDMVKQAFLGGLTSESHIHHIHTAHYRTQATSFHSPPSQ